MDWSPPLAKVGGRFCFEVLERIDLKSSGWWRDCVSLQTGEWDLSSYKRIVRGHKRLTKSVLDSTRHGSWACFFRYLPIATRTWPMFSASRVFLGLLLLSHSILLALKRPQTLKEMRLREVSALVQGHLAERPSQDGNPSRSHMLRKWDFLLKSQKKKKHVFSQVLPENHYMIVEEFF